MRRAAVLVGVERTGGMPRLFAAAEGARRMADWATAQKMDRVELLTDENCGAVHIADIKQAIKDILAAGTVEQLLIYFAGHGVNIRYGEYWLLTDAPADTQAAVNVQGSIVLAQYSGLSHVVFISDACRTAAQGINAQFVNGSEIFPNDGDGGLQRPVDNFFACTLGRPSHEIRDPNTTTKEYSAVFTEALLDALQGERHDLLSWEGLSPGSLGYLRPRPLKAYLQADVSRRLVDLELATNVIQVPDAVITSDADAWISRIKRGEAVRSAPFAPPLYSAPATNATVLSGLLKPALRGDASAFKQAVGEARGSDVAGTGETADSVAVATTPFGPAAQETGCGFKVRGATFAEAYCRDPHAELIDGGAAIRMHGVPRPGVSVMLVLDGGNGVSLPAIPGFLTALTLDGGELVDVAYEPSQNHWRWDAFRADEVRALRAVASSSVRDGVFRLDRDDALTLARQMQYAKGVDPTLAIYAAYAYQDLQRHDLIAQMRGFMRDDLGAPLFDVALLARDLTGSQVTTDTQVLGFMPLLAQGWGLLSAHRVTLPAALHGIDRHLVDSVWTLFTPEGVSQLRKAISTGEVR
jgi:hypothetical protein